MDSTGVVSIHIDIYMSSADQYAFKAAMWALAKQLKITEEDVVSKVPRDFLDVACTCNAFPCKSE